MVGTPGTRGFPIIGQEMLSFALGGPFNWASRPTQMEALMKNMKEGHHTIIKAVVERKMNSRGPGWPQGKAKPSNTPAVSYDIKGWMSGLDEASDEEQK